MHGFRGVILVGLFGLIGMAWRVEGAGVPAVEEVLARVLEKDAEVNERKKAFQFELMLTNVKLGSENEVLREEVVRALIRPGSGGAFQEIVGRANQSPEELSAGDRKEIGRSQGAMRSMDLKKLAPRFRIGLQGEGREMGVDCWILSFEPKPNQPYGSREEKVINRLTGRFWVAKSDYSIVRSAGVLSEPVEVAWVFARMRELTFDYRTMPLNGVGRVPESFELLFDVQTPVNQVRRRQTTVMSNYREAQKSSRKPVDKPGSHP